MDMKIRIAHIGWQERVFYSIWGIYTVFIYLLSISELPYIYSTENALRIVKVITIFILSIMLIIGQRYTIRRFFTCVIIIVLLFMIQLQITQMVFLINILFILSFPNKNLNRFIRFDMLLKVISIGVIFSLCAMGITDNYIHITPFAEKQSLGFSHPNVFSTFVFAVLLEWLYLRYGKMRWYDYCSIFIIWYAVYVIAASRTTAYTFILVYVMFICANKVPQVFYHRSIKCFFSFLMPTIIVLSFVIVRLYEIRSPIGIALNAAMTSRLDSILKAVRIYGIHMFGQEIEFVGTRFAKSAAQTLIVDNAYFSCLLQYGIVYFVLLCVMYTHIMNYSIKEHKIAITLFCTYYVLMGFGESYMLEPIYNIMLLYIFGGISVEHTQRKKYVIQYY